MYNRENWMNSLVIWTLVISQALHLEKKHVTLSDRVEFDIITNSFLGQQFLIAARKHLYMQSSPNLNLKQSETMAPALPITLVWLTVIYLYIPHSQKSFFFLPHEI